MFPLKDYKKIKRTYTHGVKTFYSDFHLGEDLIVPIGTSIFAPFDGIVTKKVGKESGNACYFETKDFVIRFLHCNAVYAGKKKKGELIALSGNTGKSTAPHVHLDISYQPFNLAKRGNFIDPRKFDWQEETLEDYLRTKLEEYKKKAQSYAQYYKRCVEYAKRIKKLEAEIKKLKGDK